MCRPWDVFFCADEEKIESGADCDTIHYRDRSKHIVFRDLEKNITEKTFDKMKDVLIAKAMRFSIEHTFTYKISHAGTGEVREHKREEPCIKFSHNGEGSRCQRVAPLC